MTAIPPLPKNWSELTWQQLCDMWAVKMRYASNADVARVVALLTLVSGRKFQVSSWGYNPVTGEQQYILETRNLKPGTYVVMTARELAYYAKQAIPWFDWPYGDQGDPAERNEKGKIIKERREGVKGYVSEAQDMMMLPIGELTMGRKFKLPDPACMNITWQQYRTLQNIIPDLFREGVSEEEQLSLQAKFLAHILTPRSFALFDTSNGTFKFRPHYVYVYEATRGQKLEAWWRRRLQNDIHHSSFSMASVLFHICFQCFQTALSYYAITFPYLFTSGKNVHRDALSGEVGTVNAVMMEAGYTEQQAVFDSNLPFILDILNNMAKKAEEIEKMNSEIKRK